MICHSGLGWRQISGARSTSGLSQGSRMPAEGMHHSEEAPRMIWQVQMFRGVQDTILISA